ncbi:MAG: class I SAM-dependent methyltransferase [Terriglobia bacterium]
MVSAPEGYQLWAPTYDQDPNPLLALEQRSLTSLLPCVAGKDILDVGCGTGRWLEMLLKLGARTAAGIDLSPAMLFQAGRKTLLQMRLVRGDCLKLPFQSAMADLIVCSFALSHIPDVEALARELARVARPHADCYLTDLHPSALTSGWRTGFRHAGGAVTIFNFPHSFGQVRDAFEVQDFKLVRFLEPCLAEPERAIFVQTQRAHRFDEVSRIAAVLICHFQRLRSTRETS